LMRRYDLIKEICDSMIELGWKPYQNDHEDANGQFEMNWDYSDSLITADRHVFFKFMVKNLAEKHGLRATFMPKPFNNLTGNGCHAHVSVWSGGVNKFLDKKDELGLSKLAYNFLGGLIKNAQPLSAFFNPTINSYRRIGSANPYLLQAGVMAAGIEGINKKINPGKPLHCNMYTDYKKYPKLAKLPNDVGQALNMLEKSKMLNNAFGKDVIKSYLKLKKTELSNFKRKEVFNKRKPITKWERDNTLDC
ncbi:MAG: type III glutamate--ammonia ligase, partial [Proteobacteria bacterium]|nr:type III glutamate--ammonia ligase [Pseudomonadota bacterium]